MTFPTIKKQKRGFTLLELLVAMGVTSFLIVILVAMTGVAIDSWRQSRDDIRGSKLGRIALEAVGRDFQSLVRPRGNVNEWLVAQVEQELQSGSNLAGPAGSTIPNAVQVVFFAAPTDRYDGDVANPNNPGDVSALSYRLVYRDPILDQDPGGGADDPSTFTLYRQLVNPNEAFVNLYQVPDLLSAYQGSYGNNDLTAQNFLVENIYEFTLTFLIEHEEEENGQVVTHRDYVPITFNAGTGGGAVQELRVFGDRIQTVPADPEIEQGRIVGVNISVTVLTDEGLTLARRGDIDQGDLIERFSYRYSRFVNTPSS